MLQRLKRWGTVVVKGAWLKKWWLVVVPLLASFVRSLFEDRLVGATNNFIDNHATSWLTSWMTGLKPLLLYLIQSPIALAAVTLILVTMVLVVHAYFDTRAATTNSGALQVRAYGESRPPNTLPNKAMLQARALANITNREQQRPRTIPPAEEDPKVYLDPLNADFVPCGYLPFKISNKGQRVNPAQSVNIQIASAPSIVFDYIDRIDPTEEIIVVPKVGDDFIAQDHDILPELRKAWSEAHEKGEIDSAEYSFTITIHYRDAKQIRFVTEVAMIYSPIEEERARRTALSFPRAAYPIVRVTHTEIMRLV